MSKYQSTHTGAQIDQYLDEAHALHVKEQSMPPVINLQVSASASNVSITQNLRDGSSLSLSIPSATQATAGLMSSADKASLEDTVNEISVGWDTDKLVLTVTHTGDDEDYINIPSATQEFAGVMSAADKARLDTAVQSETMAGTSYRKTVAFPDDDAGFEISVTELSTGDKSEISADEEGMYIKSAKELGISSDTAIELDAPAIRINGKNLNTESPLRKLYTNAGAVYNPTTGLYSLNGLTDITEDEMAVIYADTYRKQCGQDLSFLYTATKARTNFAPTNRADNLPELNFLDAFMFCTHIEVALIGREYQDDYPVVRYLKFSNLSEAFYSCTRLKKIIGVLNLTNCTGSLGTTFNGCNALEDVQILGLKSSLDLQSPVISYDSLRFLVDHAANTSIITVKVHPTVWDWLNGGAQPTEGHTAAEWQAINTDANAKHISFAY